MSELRPKIKLKPTTMGWYFTALVVILILLSISYSNNLLLIFSLLFLSLGIIWITESFFHNKGIASFRPEVRDIFADERPSFRLPENTEFSFYNEGHEINLREHLSRGIVKIDTIMARTTRPFGLFEFSESRSLDIEFHVYPARIKSHQLPLGGNAEEMAGDNFSHLHKEDLTGLSRYQDGNNSRIHWKYFAKTHELVMKEMEGNSSQEAFLELDNPTEEILSGLAYEIYLRKKGNEKISLKIGEEVITDYQEALRRLAEW